MVKKVFQKTINDLNELLEEANMIEDYKKGKKYITDDTIASVPLVKFPGIPSNECIAIHEMAQELLLLSKNENNNNEVAITYSLEHEKLKRNNQKYKTIVFGDEFSTDVESDTATYHLLNSTPNVVIINLHNHPSGSDFSLEDIMFFLRKDSVKLMIILPNDGGMFYLLKNNDYSRALNVQLLASVISSVSPNALVNQKLHFSELNEKQMIEIAEKFIANSHSNGIDYSYVAPMKNIDKSHEDEEDGIER